MTRDVWITILGAAVASALVAALTPPAMRLGRRWRIVDMPGARKVHRRPIPRTGGLAICIGTAVAVMAVVATLALLGGVWSGAMWGLTVVMSVSIVVMAVGFADDAKDLSSKLKLLVLLTGAAATWFAGARIDVAPLGLHGPSSVGLSLLLSVLFITGVTVSVNFIDGLDGLAAGVVGIAGAALGVGCLLAGSPLAAAAPLAIAGGRAGFSCIISTPPARSWAMAGACSSGSRSPPRRCSPRGRSGSRPGWRCRCWRWRCRWWTRWRPSPAAGCCSAAPCSRPSGGTCTTCCWTAATRTAARC